MAVDLTSPQQEDRDEFHSTLHSDAHSTPFVFSATSASTEELTSKTDAHSTLFVFGATSASTEGLTRESCSEGGPHRKRARRTDCRRFKFRTPQNTSVSKETCHSHSTKGLVESAPYGGKDDDFTSELQHSQHSPEGSSAHQILKPTWPAASDVFGAIPSVQSEHNHVQFEVRSLAGNLLFGPEELQGPLSGHEVKTALLKGLGVPPNSWTIYEKLLWEQQEVQDDQMFASTGLLSFTLVCNGTFSFCGYWKGPPVSSAWESLEEARALHEKKFLDSVKGGA